MKRYKQKEEHDRSIDDKKRVKGQDTSKSFLGKSHCILKPKACLDNLKGIFQESQGGGDCPIGSP